MKIVREVIEENQHLLPFLGGNNTIPANSVHTYHQHSNASSPGDKVKYSIFYKRPQV